MSFKSYSVNVNVIFKVSLSLMSALPNFNFISGNQIWKAEVWEGFFLVECDNKKDRVVAEMGGREGGKVVGWANARLDWVPSVWHWCHCCSNQSFHLREYLHKLILEPIYIMLHLLLIKSRLFAFQRNKNIFLIFCWHCLESNQNNFH